MKHVIKNRLRSTAIVTLKDGSSFRGVLFDYDSDGLVLRGAELLVSGAERPAPIDGELVALWANVLYIQIP